MHQALGSCSKRASNSCACQSFCLLLFFCFFSEPSKPRNVSHAFVYSKADKLIYLKLQWQRPLHTGANTYSYIVRRQASPVSSKQPVLPQHIIKVVFPLCEYSLIDGDNFGVWLVLEAMKTEGNNVQHRVTVSAVNDVREGEMKMFETRGEIWLSFERSGNCWCFFVHFYLKCNPPFLKKFQNNLFSVYLPNTSGHLCHAFLSFAE